MTIVLDVITIILKPYFLFYRYCEWTYNGLGIDYQVLAGPSFIAVFTIVGVVMGFLADKFNRFVNKIINKIMDR